MEKLDQKIHYYEYDNFVLIAKKGERNRLEDIYQYDDRINGWDKILRSNKQKWVEFYTRIRREGFELTEEKLKELGIPLINE